jgi:ABC-2 type transport system ATP-binding protein
MSGNTAARLEGVSRSFGEREALREVSFRVERGSVVGLLGPNGAGKSTALRILLGLLRPDAGRSEVFGEDSMRLSRTVRQRLGYLSEREFPHGDLPVAVLLRWMAAFFDRWDDARVRGLAALMGVDLARNLRDLSVGQRRKAELFLCLAPDPELLVLDDPWLGIDAIARAEVLDVVLRAARDEGKTVLFTSHVLGDVERIADRIVLLSGARVRADDDLDALKARTKRWRIEPAPGVAPVSLRVPGEVKRTVRGGILEVVTDAHDPAAVETLRAAGHAVDVEDLDLEAIFVALGAEAPAPAESAA